MRANLFALVLLWLCALPVHAHTLSVAHVDVAAGPGGDATVEIDVALRDLALSIPLDANGDNVVTWGELKGQQAKLSELLSQGVRMEAGASRCALRPGLLGTRSYDGVAYASMAFSTDCRLDGTLSIRYDLIFDQDPAHRAIVAWRTGSQVRTDILQDDSRSARFDPSSTTGRSSTFLQFVREGVHHILGGIDHLAFLLALLLPAVLIWQQGRWRPAPRVSSSLRSVAGVVTAFTLAHSITLSLAALGIVRPDGRLVEIIIAISVLLAALNNLKPLVTRRIWLVAFAFGLIHGMGFARALQDLGLPRGQELLALLGFNLGVELGQLGVVALAFPALAIARRREWYSRLAMPAASLLIAIAALYWIAQRISG